MLILRLAWRNLWRNPRRTQLVLTGSAVGIAGVVLAMSINYGMVMQMVQTAIATELGHLQIHAPGYHESSELRLSLADGGAQPLAVARALRGVRGAAARVRGEGLLFSPHASTGVRVLGVEPEAEARVSTIAQSLVAGQYFHGAQRPILLGEGLAQRLHLEVGQKVVLSVEDARGELTGEAFRVVGLFRTSSSAFDRNTAYLELADGQRLFALGDAVNEVVIVMQQGRAVADLLATLRSQLGSAYEVHSWAELQPLLVYLVEVFDSVAWYIYAAIFAAMAFGIANLLMMSVLERTREIGMLLAIGLPPRVLVAAIALESLLVTALGVLLGFLAALFGLWLLHDGIDLSRFEKGLTAYGVGTRIVPILKTDDLFIPCLAALITAAVASLWPAVRAVKLKPAEALRAT